MFLLFTFGKTEQQNKGRYLSRRNIPSKGPPLFYILIQQSTVHKAKSSQSLLKACDDTFANFAPFPILVSFCLNP